MSRYNVLPIAVTQSSMSVVLASLLFFFMFPSGVLAGFLVTSGAYTKFSQVLIASSTLTFLGKFLCTQLDLRTVEPFIVSDLAGQLLAIILSVRALAGLRIWPPIPSESALQGLNFYRYGAEAQWGVAMKLLIGKIDLVVLSSTLSPGSLGQLGVAISFREMSSLPLSVVLPFFQNSVIDAEKTSPADSKRVFLSWFFASAGLFLICAFSGYFILPIFVSMLYGNAYAESANIVPIMFAGGCLNALAGLCWQYFQAKNRPLLVGSSLTLVGLLSPICLFLLSRHWGLIGAAYASFFVNLSLLGVSLFFTWRISRFTLGELKNTSTILLRRFKNLGPMLRGFIK